jgi:hypothetical protein
MTVRHGNGARTERSAAQQTVAQEQTGVRHVGPPKTTMIVAQTGKFVV